MTKISTFITQFENGIISRRDFVKALMAVGLSISSIDGILALSEAKAAAVNPKKGGILKAAFALGSPNETLDPARAYSDIDSSRAFQVYNTLVWLTPDLKPVPELAESWEGNKTADEWTFRSAVTTAATVTLAGENWQGMNNEGPLFSFVIFPDVGDWDFGCINKFFGVHVDNIPKTFLWYFGFNLGVAKMIQVNIFIFIIRMFYSRFRIGIIASPNDTITKPCATFGDECTDGKNKMISQP